MTLKIILLIQGLYYLATGIWPLLNIKTFMQVTGPKTDIWLVKMVGLLTVAIAVTLLAQRSSREGTIAELAVSAALAYFLIDVYYGFTGAISPVYLADAAIQVTIAATICLRLFSRRKR